MERNIIPLIENEYWHAFMLYKVSQFQKSTL